MIGLVLTGGVVAQEFNRAPALGAATVPDQAPAEEQPQHNTANATAGSIPTYRYEPHRTGPAYPTAPLPFHSDGP